MAICPTLLTTGACGEQGCSHNHNVKTCAPCGVMCTSDAIYQSHMQGKRHKAKISGRSAIVACTLCEVNVVAGSWDMHISGKGHRGRAERDNVDPDIQQVAGTTPAGEEHCSACDINVPQRFWPNHLRSPLHARKEKFARFRAALAEGEKDKNGVTVSHVEDGLDFGVTDPAKARDGVEVNLIVKCTVPSSSIVIKSLQLASSNARRPTNSYDYSLCLQLL